MEDKGEADGNLKLQPLPEMISESFPGNAIGPMSQLKSRPGFHCDIKGNLDVGCEIDP